MKTKRGKAAGGRVNLFDLSAGLREEFYRLAGEHKQAVKKGASKSPAPVKLTREIERVTNCLQAMSWDLDD